MRDVQRIVREYWMVEKIPFGMPLDSNEPETAKENVL